MLRSQAEHNWLSNKNKRTQAIVQEATQQEAGGEVATTARYLLASFLLLLVAWGPLMIRKEPFATKLKAADSKLASSFYCLVKRLTLES